METLKFVLGLICASLLCGSLVSSTYVAEVAKECNVVIYGKDSRILDFGTLILAHRGQVANLRPVFQQVGGAGNYGNITLSMSSSKVWQLWDGETNLGAEVKDAQYWNCFPQDQTLDLGIATMYGATTETLCRPMAHRFTSAGQKLEKTGVDGYFACLQSVATEHPSAIGVEFGPGGCWYFSGASTPATTAGVGTWTSCLRDQTIKLPGIGQPPAAYRRSSVLGVCQKVENYIFHYASYINTGLTATFEECAQLIAEQYPVARAAQWDRTTKMCQRKGSNRSAIPYEYNVNYDSCEMRLCDYRPDSVCTPEAVVYDYSIKVSHGPLLDFETCSHKVLSHDPDALVAQYNSKTYACESKKGDFVSSAASDANTKSCRLQVSKAIPSNCTPEEGKIYHYRHYENIGKTFDFDECARRIAAEHPDSMAVQFNLVDNSCQTKGHSLRKVENNVAYISCQLVTRRLLEVEPVVLHDTESCEECAQQVVGMHIEATGAQWGLAAGANPKVCQALFDNAQAGDATNWSPCKINFCSKLSGKAINTGPNNNGGTYLRLKTSGGIGFEQCARMIGQSYPTGHVAMTNSGQCEVKWGPPSIVGHGPATSCITDVVRRRGPVKFDDREGMDVDMGNAESLDECARIVRAADATNNGASYDETTKKCYAVPEMISADSTSFELRSNWKSVMIPHIPRRDYTDPKNINLELFYVQELTLSYCGESTCYTFEDEAEARQGKQQTVKREMFPMFKELSEEYASLKMGYLEFADKGIYPLGQSGRDWCHRFLNSMTPFNDEYKLWVEDHWNRTWASQPSGMDYVENQLDAAITSVMKGDFSTEDFDAEGKLNLRVLFMLTDKGFHVAGDVAAAGKCVEGNCKDYVPSVDQCQCVEHEYPSVDQTVDAMAKAKVNVLIYLGDIGQSYVKDLYDSVNVKLNEEDPSLQAVTVAPTEQGIQYFSPALFRQGLDALRTAVGSQA